jgi:hypothetical protein
LPSISKNVRWRFVRPTFSMSVVRNDFWQELSRREGGSSSPEK